MYCIAADSDAVAATTIVYAIAPVSSSLRTTFDDRRRLLPDRDVDADQVLALLVDDRVDRDRRLAGLAVADDQLALAAADRHHRVDRLEPVCTGCFTPSRAITPGATFSITSVIFALTGPLPSIGSPERVDDAADQLGADRHREDAAGALDRVALGDVLVLAEHDRADRVALEVEREAERVVRELEHLALHRVGKTVDAADAVGDRDDRPLRARLRARVEVLDLGLDQLADFGRVQLHDMPLVDGRVVTPSIDSSWR
jgi:hypothetical protein